jgi:putative transcription factor
MANCELCGAEKTSIRSVKMGRATVEACIRCIESMGLQTIATPTPRRTTNLPSSSSHGGYSGLGKAGKDIMHRGSKELRDDFSKVITDAREKKGWDKRELARRMAVKFNMIQAAESGKRPTDNLIKKLERTLGITLMVEVKPDENRQVGEGSSRGMTLGDFLED